MDNDRIELLTDSSGNGSLGCETYFSGHWVQFKWPSNWVKKDFMSDMSFLELVPILAMLSWSDQFKNKKMLLRIDNQDLVSIINKRTSQSKYIMQLIRPFVLMTMNNNTQFKALHVLGVHNEIADALSRFQIDRFRCLALKEDQTPSEIPVEFLMTISNLK